MPSQKRKDDGTFKCFTKTELCMNVLRTELNVKQTKQIHRCYGNIT